MTKRLAIFLMTLFAFGFAIAGCGGDDEDEKSSAETDTAPRTSATDAATSRDAEAAPSQADAPAPPAASGGGDVRGAQQRIAEACKKRYRRQPNVSSNVLQALEGMCDEGAARDQQGLREANKEVCRRIVEENAPADRFGSGRAEALRLCDQR